MDPELMTLFVVISLVLVTIGADLFLGLTYGVKYTISEQIRGLGSRWPLFILIAGLASGLLLGHFFLCPDCAKENKPAIVAPAN